MGWEWSPSYPQGAKRYRAREVRLLGLGKSIERAIVQIDRGKMDGLIDFIKDSIVASVMTSSQRLGQDNGDLDVDTLFDF